MKRFEHELSLLREHVAQMGDLAEGMVSKAVQALSDPDNDSRFETLLGEESRLDQMQLDVDKEAIRLLTVYGPVAANLRMILAVPRINSELERIGDQAVNLYSHLQLMASQTEVKPLPQFREMARIVQGMIHEMLKAFRLDDSAKAQAIMANDDLLDALNDQVLRDLLTGNREQPAINGTAAHGVAAALSQILVSHALERMADHVCNACEQIVYMVEGADIRHGGRME